MASSIHEQVDDYKQELLDREKTTIAGMAALWSATLGTLQDTAERLARKIRLLTNKGEKPSPKLIQQQEEYRRLSVDAEDKYVTFSRGVDKVATSVRNGAIDQGVADAEHILVDAGVDPDIALVDAEALTALKGALAPDTPIGASLMQRYPTQFAAIESALAEGIEQGLNPREVAIRMVKATDLSLNNSLRIARTELMRSYREAGRAAYEQSKVVKKYRRMATKDTRTCAACLALDGTIYPIKVPLIDHPNGRCTLVPIVDGAPPPEWQTADKWFEGLEDEEQYQILGPAKFNAYKANKFSFDQLAKLTRDPTWGGTLSVATLRDLGLK